MKKRKRLLLTLGIPVALIATVFVLSLWVLFTRQYSVLKPFPATYNTLKNSSATWREFSSKIITLSYPPGWTIKECVKECLDTPQLSLQSEKNDSFLLLSYYGPAADCSTTQVQQWRAWHEMTLPETMTKDGLKFDMVEGKLNKDLNDQRSPLQHKMYAKLLTPKNICIDITASDGKDTGIIKQILNTLVIKK